MLGLPVVSVATAVLFSGKAFPWGGAAGSMVKEWLNNVFGQVGTIGILVVAVLSYVIWRFNPVFKLPAKKHYVPVAADNTDNTAVTDIEEDDTTSNIKTNSLKEEGTIMVLPPQDTNSMIHEISLTEKDTAPENSVVVPPPTQIEEPIKPVPKIKQKDITPLELEIKTVTDKTNSEEDVVAALKPPAFKPYDPILDLRDYKYPQLDLLENHGSEKIVQDANELENNKNQIINTLKNYDILIQKISATVGPTVTLYEIIPAAGVRISRIKNLEDDIALSLAALGIRIIAPIPGKGTIGIEVPNAKKNFNTTVFLYP
jgi:DNA segregation ATPase FtsK/SpoIIIE, S-DNA-T family